MKKLITQRMLVAAMALGISGAALAHDEDRNAGHSESQILRGFAIAPVPLNLRGKNLALVGLGSYIVNAVADCNGCHSRSPATQYVPGGNPYFGQKPTKVDPATYLGGGRDFGPFPGPGFPNIVSRNLTPNRSGLPEGGSTFAEFLLILRTGVDLDHAHPTCTGAPNGTCIPPPFDGSLLQIMPWPTYKNMSDHDIRAIYEYLRAIPCVEGGPRQLANRC